MRELQPLAQTIAATVEGLHQAFEKQHQFVSDAAHELKTAVAVLRSTTQVLMLKPRSQAEYQEGLERLLVDCSRVEGLVSQMLRLARFEEGTQSDVVVTDLSDGVHRAVQNLRMFAEEHTVELVTSISDGLRVRLQLDQAETLASNLIVNAVQHSPYGSKVVVSLARTEDAAVLRVCDEGRGISAEAQPHVFDRFYREDVSRSRGTGGAGLGLAICKSIVERAGGSIAIESTQGKGTTVTAIFRLASAPFASD